MNNKLIEDFALRYGARLKYQQPRNSIQTYASSYDYYDNTRSIVDIELPMRAFEHLVEMDNQAEHDYRVLKEEAHVRARHPSVAAAYSQYKMLLALCR